MKAYLVTTGVLFGLIAVTHVLRLFAEWPHLATHPWFLLLTGLAVALCVWALTLLRRGAGAESPGRTR